MVLHRNEGREAIIDRVIYSEKMIRRADQLLVTRGAHSASDGLVCGEEVGLARNDELVTCGLK